MRILVMLAASGVLGVGLLPAADATVLCSVSVTLTRGSVSFTNYAWTARGEHACVGLVHGSLTASRPGSSNVNRECDGVLTCTTGPVSGTTIRFFSPSLLGEASTCKSLGPA